MRSVSAMPVRIVFLAQSMTELPAGDDWLSEGEKAILAGLRFPKRRADWRLGRWTAKRAICRYEAKDFSSSRSLEIRAAADGAPEAFWNNTPADLSLSISHSHGRSLCAIGPPGNPIGCDLEWIEPRDEGFAGAYFVDEEARFAERSPLGRSVAVNLIWSAKESVMKALRQGLRLDTRSIVIAPETQMDALGWARFHGTHPESSGVFTGWWRIDCGFVCTIASRRPALAPEPLTGDGVLPFLP